MLFQFLAKTEAALLRLFQRSWRKRALTLMILANYFGRNFQHDHADRLNTEVADFNTVQEALAAVGEELGVQVIIQREDVFQFMYKI